MGRRYARRIGFQRRVRRRGIVFGGQKRGGLYGSEDGSEVSHDKFFAGASTDPMNLRSIKLTQNSIRRK